MRLLGCDAPGETQVKGIGRKEQLSADDLIKLHRGANAQEQLRVVALIASIPNLSEREREHLAGDLMRVAGAPNEIILRRVQAARILGHHGLALGIFGSTQVRDALMAAIKGQFIPEVVVSNSSHPGGPEEHTTTRVDRYGAFLAGVSVLRAVYQ